MNKIDVIAVLKGLGVNILLSFVLGFVAKFFMGSIPGVTVTVSFVLLLAIGLLCCFASGYVAAWSAKTEPIFNVLVLCGVLLALGVVLAFAAKFPLWYSIASFVLVVPFTYAGGYAFMRTGGR